MPIAGGHVELVPFDHHRLRDRFQQLLGDDGRAAGILDVGEKNR